ncbi:MAG: trypsin-like peptidase domain-containing protein [Steroidobacteraceae bacterium]
MRLISLQTILCALASFVLLGFTATPVRAADTAANEIENATVKIFSTLQAPDFRKPWSKQNAAEATASGVVIEGRRILTNAHAVIYASQIQVQANQSGTKLTAQIEAIAPGIDLAVLKLEDESFFDTHPALARSSALPGVKDEVMAYGYPTGGASLSITKGIVSRIEFVNYTSSFGGLRIQVDAAINPGNSGGPVVAGNKMVGLAFSRATNAQNIGYIIPNEEIELFLNDVKDGRYDGKPAMFDEFQPLQNAALRTYLKLDGSVTGIVVCNPRGDDSRYPLKEWDVITQIADKPIDNEGMINLENNLRLRFQYLLQSKASNNEIALDVVRAGKKLQVRVPLLTTRPLLIADLGSSYPSYFIYGPIVFSSVSEQFLSLFTGNATALNALTLLRSPLLTQRSAPPDADRDELVMVSNSFFSHKLSVGYGSHSSSVLNSVNGVRVRSLAHLVALLRDSKDEFVVFKFEESGSGTLVFPRQEMVAATEQILSDNGVRNQGSADMMAVWQGKAKR